MTTKAEATIAANGTHKRAERPYSPYWQLLFAESENGPGATYAADLGNEVENLTFIRIPTHVVGHKHIAHGGFLATLLDEALCRCGFAALPHQVGVTASLELAYKAPTPAGSWIVLRATAAKPEKSSRKALVTGHIYVVDKDSEQMPWEYAQPTIESKLVVVEPVWWEKLLVEHENAPAAAQPQP